MSRRGPIPLAELAQAQAGLKSFQQRTVRAVVEAMFDAVSPQRRFLVADEVGLGKTKIARAVVAETIKRLWEDKGIDRIDIVYICSNHQIARQNVEDLRVLGGTAKNIADRITMLPAVLDDLATASVNLVAFTPDTSLRFGMARGRVRERAMLFHLLSQPGALGSQVMARKGSTRLLSLDTASFDWALTEARRAAIPHEVAVQFRAVLERDGLIDEFWRYSDGRARFEMSELEQFVGRLRRALAKACIDLLTPDLVILDEFQRFTHVLDGEGPDGELASMLFNQSSARVLLLSATPYKMLTNAADDESHFEGFSRTVGFLLGKNRAADLDALQPALAALRHGVLGHRDVARLAAARDRVQSLLRRVMVRTERLAATPGRDGMLRTDIDVSCPVTRSDVESFVGTDAIARSLDEIPTMVEYWKSAPYLFNFMDGYQVKHKMKATLDADDGSLRSSLSGPHMLNWEQLERYRRVDPRNSRLRWLVDDLTRHASFDLLWIPPAMPQTELGGVYARHRDFTKRLIFSGWTVVPKAVSALASYEFERRHHRSRQTHQRRKNFAGRLLLAKETERFTNLALLLPCARLAELGDPVSIAHETGRSLPLPLSLVRRAVRDRLRSELGPLLAEAADTGPTLNRWYAAAQIHLDPGLAVLEADDWIGRAEDKDRDSAGLAEHLRRLQELRDQPASAWGKPPENLIEDLAEVATASPAVCILRSLRRLRTRFGWQASDLDLGRATARLAWAFRTVVNSAEADHIVSSGSRAGEDFWRSLLRHCAEGGLGSVLDEWFHLLPDQQRLGPGSEDPLDKLVKAAIGVFKLGDGRVGIDLYGKVAEDDAAHLMRTHFAMRFGQARGVTAEGENPVDVRNAFNSPFRPFVLVSTSVGQEGLDFHHYAHAIVHWNLPSNPMDLEQREGRVHRYKNHAVRKNVADVFGSTVEVLEGGDPWTRAFELAEDGIGGMTPWWVYPGRAAIERLVPTLPMSREIGRLEELVKATGLYRMTMGQPRQAELLEVLAGLEPSEQEAIREAITIDLSPRR